MNNNIIGMFCDHMRNKKKTGITIVITKWCLLFIYIFYPLEFLQYVFQFKRDGKEFFILENFNSAPTL